VSKSELLEQDFCRLRSSCHSTNIAYAAANGGFSHNEYVSDVVRLSVIDTYVLRIMTCAVEAFSLTRCQYSELSFVCWKNLFRRIFSMHKLEAVKVIQYYCGKSAL